MRLSPALLLLLIPAIAAANPSAREAADLEKQAQAETLAHKKLQAEAAQINLELSSISREMVGTARQIQNYEDSLSSMESDLAKLEADLAAAERQFALDDENLIRTLAALQNLALKPTEALFVQPLTPVEIVRSAMILRETVPYLEESAQKLREKLADIERKKKSVERQVAKIVSQKKDMQGEHERMTALVQRKSKVRSDVEVKSAQSKKKADALAQEARDLRDLLGKLEAERIARRKKQAEERRRLAAQEAQAAAAETGSAQKQEDKKPSGLIKLDDEVINETGAAFAQAKGKLIPPARGSIVSRFDEEQSKGVKSKGIAIKTRGRAQVVAPFDGLVVFAGPFRGYGNMIIVEHGKGFLTLMSGMESVDAELGQMLLAGEPVGQMPNSSDARLYLELRKDSQPINPLAWLER